MKKKNKLILVIILIIICSNLKAHCKSLKNNFFVNKYILYEKIKKELRKNNFNNAISILEKIKKNNIANMSDDKIQINLIYAYYKNLNFDMAQKNIEEFIYLYPNHLNMDYVVYIKCLINIALDKNTFFNFLPFSQYKNDPHYAINAFFQLKNLIYKYPKSLYVTNAKKDLICLKNRLSEHDFQILKFYFIHKEYISVVNRGEEMLQKYPETRAARKALIYMKKSFFALKIFDTAKKISKIILLNKIQEI